MDAKETSFYAAILIVCGVVGVIIIYFIVSIIRQQRRTVKLYKQSLLTEIATLEKERSRMASDLHDEVGPVLSAIKLRISSLDIHNPTDEEQVDKTNQQIDKLLKRMREISFDLMPTSLTRKGIAAALSEFIEYCSKDSTLKINFQFTDIDLSQPQAINLYRIVQEVIHNTIKHAEATELMIELRQEKNLIVLSTRDNGKGFNYDEKAQESSGLGLQNLLRRTEILGGKMFFESKKGKGTTYIFEIPIAIDENHNADQDNLS
jgi:two-component system, NarL family, sensor kinase